MEKLTPSSRLIRIGAFELDPTTGELARDGRKTQLTVQLLQVLLALLENPGELVTREELVRRLWPKGTFVDFDHSLNKAVNKLREALGDSADTPSYIQTLPRRGYRLVATVEKPVEELPRTAAEPAVPEQASDLERVTSGAPATLWRTKRFYLGLGAGAAGLLVVLSIFVPRWWDALSGSASAHTLTERDTVLVADFINKTGDSVFDEALKEGLLADLGQSPFLNILSDGAVRQQLRYMGRPADTVLTAEIARDVCRRADSRAMLLGSIASLGRHYAITLKAINCADGNPLNVEQQEADSREHVLGKLHEAARSMRRRLGESLASIEKHDIAMYSNATTSSLEALEAYGLAMKTWRSNGDASAVPLFKRATEIDPKFAVANVALGVVYANLGQAALSSEYITKAYRLRDQVSEWERFSIDSAYYLNVTGEQDKAIEVNDQWRQIYPRVATPRVNLGVSYQSLGWIDRAVAEDLEAVKLAPHTAMVYSNLASDYVALNRWQDAKNVLEQARARQLSAPMLINYQLAFLQDDAKEMEQYVSAGVDGEARDMLLASHADTEAFHGRLTKAREFSRRAVEAALRNHDKEAAAGWLATEALREAEFGSSGLATKKAASALGLTSARDVEVAVALALARAGESGRAQVVIDTLLQKYPKNTLIVNSWLPTIRAAIALQRKQPATAVENLKVAAPYELGVGRPPFTVGASMYPVYLRGEAFLALHQWAEAAAEFEKIVEHRGLAWNSPQAALAQLRLGQAYAGAGDTAKARLALQQFLQLWIDADPENSLYRSAKAETARLK